MKNKKFYGHALPGMDPDTLSGMLVVIEGPDSSGRTTQIELLSGWLERMGYAVARVGLNRSKLVAPALAKAKEGNVLSPRTMSLFYATDFYDQLENTIIPALNAGYVVLSDRYIYTLMARDLVRGADSAWVESLYSMAIIPDAVYFLMASTKSLVERSLTVNLSLDYWESGMDIGISRDWYDSFVRYQRVLRSKYRDLQDKFGFEMLNANRSVKTIQRDLRGRIETVLREIYR